MENKRPVWWRFLPHFFYSISVLVWFKDNFAPLRELRFSHLFALIPFAASIALILVRRAPWKNIRLPRRISKETAALLGLILLAVILRLPLLAAPSGTMTSDDAIPALMGKHIAEGKVPPICYYGQLYMGSLSSHYFALVFRVFGYSILALKCATLLIYLLFMAVQFFFLRRIFSAPFALAVTLFFTLPTHLLLDVGFDNTSAFGLVLLFGTVMLYFAHLISFETREDLLPALGFVMGLSFWTHPITASFILTAFLIIAFKFRFRAGKYAGLVLSAALGFLPQLLIELPYRFQLFAYLSGGKRVIDGDKLKSTLDLTVSLLTLSSHPTRYVFLIILFFGVGYLFYFSLKKKAFSPPAIYGLHLLLFYVLYIFSHFSGKDVIRYLFPLYVSMPVVLLAAFLFLRSKWRTYLPFVLVLILFTFYNLKETLDFMKLSRERHLRMARVISAMKDTGRRYWLADYWTSYLLTCVSNEKLIVESHTVRRYAPYSLAYWDRSNKDNYVFLLKDDPVEADHYANVGRWAKAAGLKMKQREVDGCRLAYDIKPRLYPRALTRNPPARVPSLELASIQPQSGYLRLLLRNASPGGNTMFVLTANIPGYSSRKLWFSSSQDQVSVDLPFPAQPSFTVSYHLDYAGVRIPSSAREFSYSPSPEAKAERRDSAVHLHGLGPEILYDGQNRTLCQKEARFEINPPAADGLQLRLHLYSPFRFSRVRWYGRYVQSVRIEVNDVFLAERDLKDEASVVSLSIPKDLLRAKDNVVNLKFRYQQWFPGVPVGMTAAFLDKAEVL
jgi:hypothetical protein